MTRKSGAARRRHARHEEEQRRAIEMALTTHTAKEAYPSSIDPPTAAKPQVVATTTTTTTTTLKRKTSWHKAKEHVLTRRRYSMLVGALLGIGCVAVMNGFTLPPPNIEGMIQLPADTMQTLRDAFNSDWSKRVKEDLLASIDYHPLLYATPDRPGLELSRKLSAYSPVIMVPGFTSTGLEVWNGSECSRSYFRQRMWGTVRALQTFVVNQKCWMEHLMLNRTTGLDPDGIKLRAASGLEAADYVVGGYWVWGKVIENLADIGYDSNNMFMAAYDWRLAPALLEERDKYFTKLKYMIELAQATNDNRKVVVLSHSYGSQIWYYFMKWVESEHGGNAGPSWINDHIEASVNIAGSTLGTVKSISVLLSGEMKDTAELGALSKILAYFFGPAARVSLARSWPSAYTMLPIGGQAIWGNASWSPDDTISRYPMPVEDGDGDVVTHDASSMRRHLQEHGSNGQMLQFVNQSLQNVTAGEIRALLGVVDPMIRKFLDSVAVEPSATPSSKQQDHPRYWANPLATTLPFAPNMKIFSLYGVGKPVERGYVYRDSSDILTPEDQQSVPWVLHTDMQHAPWIRSGIRFSDGDGTVPLISLGFMAARGWRSPVYNPSNLTVRIREYPHNPATSIFEARGGPSTSDHVDIMGNHDLISDLLHIAARRYDQVPEHIVSEIRAVSKRVPLPM